MYISAYNTEYILHHAKKWDAYIDLDFVVEVQLIVEHIISIIFAAVCKDRNGGGGSG